MFELPMARLAQDDLERRYTEGEADYAEALSRAKRSMLTRGELGEATWDVDHVLVQLLIDGKSDCAGAVLQAVFDDYVQSIAGQERSNPIRAAQRVLKQRAVGWTLADDGALS